MTASSQRANGNLKRLRALWNQDWLKGLLLVIAIVFAYQPAWRAGFIWDDDFYVTNNPLLTAPDGLKRIWFSLDSPSQYFPLTYTTFRIERAFWGLNPAGYHWVNILLHAANALLVWRLLKRLSVPGAWLAAAIFALHPVQVESVAWITERKNVLSLFFFLLALLAWIEFVEDRPKPWWRFYFLSLFFYALALFSKTTACTLPAALLLILWLKVKPINQLRLAQVMPFLATGVVMGLVTVWWERYHQGTQGAFFSYSLLERILIASQAIWFYAGKLLWPVNLTFVYPHWAINPANLFAYGWLVAGAGLSAAICFIRRFAGRGVEVAVLFYVATLSPLLGFIMLYTFHYTFVADHYQYVACLGPIALVAGGTATALRMWARGKPIVKLTLCGALLLTLGVLTWRQSRMYAGPETLWRTTIARNPNSYLACCNLGSLLLQTGRMDEAINQYKKALEIQPHYALADNGLGMALFQNGQVDEAIAQYKITLEIQPDYYAAYNNLANALAQKGQLEEAVAQYKKALEIQPESAAVHCNLGNTLLHMGRLDEALAHYQKAVAIQPHDAKNRDQFGNALMRAGRVEEAIAQYKRGLEIQPDNVEFYNHLGNALIQNGQLDEAAIHFQKVLELQPRNAVAHDNLGNVFLQAGRVREAMEQFQRVLEIRPASADALNNLAWTLATCPDASVRNGVRAAALAEQANQLSQGTNPAILDTLAAAYAEGERFPEAVEAAQRAFQAATNQNRISMADIIRMQISLYQAGCPFRDTSLTKAPARSETP